MSNDYSPFYSEASSGSDEKKVQPVIEEKVTVNNVLTNVNNELKEETPGRKKLKQWLNRNFRIVMTDGRILIGEFLCTDADANVILGLCGEYTQKGDSERFLGLVMVPGRHIVSMEVDSSRNTNNANKNSTYIL